MVYEKDTELLTPVERRMRANNLLYGQELTEDPDINAQFTTNYDLSEYNQILDRYADTPAVGSLTAADTEMQAYKPEPVLSPTFRPEIHIPVIDAAKPEAVAEIATKTIADDELKTASAPTAGETATVDSRQKNTQPPATRQWETGTALHKDSDTDGVYVLKMKSPLLIASVCAAVVMVLLTSLLIVNAINMAAGAAQLANYEQQLKIADEKYVAAQLAAEQARSAVIEEIKAELALTGNQYQPLPVGHIDTVTVRSYQEPIDYESKTNAFDIICEFFSKLFG
jgi:hypothetical protein